MTTRQRLPGQTVVIGSVVIGLLALSLGPTSSLAADKPELRLSEPYPCEDRLCLDVSLLQMFDQEILAALESGLPATLLFRWRIWKQRSSWWDSEVSAGGEELRIFYDVLDDRYDMFDGAGRNIATGQSIESLEEVLGEGQRLEMARLTLLRTDHRYYVEVKARLEPLDEEEIRDLENWLGGSRRQDSEELLSDLARHAVGLLKDMAGLGGRTIRAKSAAFSGWE